MRNLACLAAALLLAACATTPPDPFVPADRDSDRQKEIQLFASFYTGTFESIGQGAGEGDSTKSSLRIARVWPERAAEYWFYAEYTRGSGKPYMQRLVRAVELKGQTLILEYSLPGGEARFVGAWRDPKAAFAGVDPRSLQELPDCRQQLGVLVTMFNGGTLGKACRAHVPEGAYEISEFFLSSSSLRAWDRGYDPAGKVVWGSAAGPLEMRRMTQVPK